MVPSHLRDTRLDGAHLGECRIDFSDRLPQSGQVGGLRLGANLLLLGGECGLRQLTDDVTQLQLVNRCFELLLGLCQGGGPVRHLLTAARGVRRDTLEFVDKGVVLGEVVADHSHDDRGRELIPMFEGGAHPVD